MQKVTLRLDSKNIYSALESFSGISQQQIMNALAGDESAGSAIAQLRDTQELRKANAKAVFGNLKEGVNSMGTVIKEEAEFLTHTGNSLKEATTNWAQSRLADKQMTNHIEETKRRSDNHLIEEDYSHQKRINLLSTEHKTNIEIIRLKDIQAKELMGKQVTAERQKLSLRGRTEERLQTVHRIGGGFLKALGEGLSIFV